MNDRKFVLACAAYFAGVGACLYVLGQPSANEVLALPDGWPDIIGAIVGGLIGAGGAYAGVRFEHRETARRERQAALEQEQQARDRLKALLAAELVQIASAVAAGARQMLDSVGQRAANVLGNVLAYSEPPRAFYAMTNRLDILLPQVSVHLLSIYSHYERIRSNHAQWRMMPQNAQATLEGLGMLVLEWEVLLGHFGVALSIMDADLPLSATQAISPDVAPTLREEIARLSGLFQKYSAALIGDLAAERQRVLSASLHSE